MSKKPNTKMIGLFTLTGLALFIGSLMLFLEDKLFINDDDLVVLYFDESIKGLSVGSSVVLQGVEVGKVAKIDLITDEKKLTFKIPVYVKLNATQVVSEDGNRIKSNDRDDFLNLLVEKGLRGRLISQNLLTGQLMIELVFVPDSPLVYRGTGRKHVEIPTTLSALGEISKGLQDLPIKDTFNNFNKMLLRTTEMVNNLDNSLKTTKGDFANTTDNLNKTLRDFGDAARSMRNLSDYLERHPEALIRGKGKY